MAVRFDAASEHYTRVGVALPAWTVCFWFFMSGERGGQGPFAFGGVGASGRTIFLGGNTNLKCYDLNDNGAGFGAYAVSVGTWYRTAITVNGTNCSWHRGTSDVALTAASVANIANAGAGSQTWQIGINSFANDWWNGRVAAAKMWSAELTAAEVESELGQYVPLRTTDLIEWHPFLLAETTDYSGNGNALSGGVGATTEDGPPIPWSGARPRLILPTVLAGPSSYGTLGLASTARVGKVAATGGVTALGGASTSRAGKVAAATGVGSAALVGHATARKVALTAGTAPVVVGSVFSRPPLSAQGGVNELGLTTSATLRKIAFTGGTCSFGAATTALQRKVAPAAGVSALALVPSGGQRKLATSRGLTALTLTGNASGRKTGRQGGVSGLVLVTTQARPVVYAWPPRAGSVTVRRVATAGEVTVR